MAHNCNRSSEETETGRSLGLVGQLNLQDQDLAKDCLKILRERLQKTLTPAFGLCVHASTRKLVVWVFLRRKVESQIAQTFSVSWLSECEQTISQSIATAAMPFQPWRCICPQTVVQTKSFPHLLEARQSNEKGN